MKRIFLVTIGVLLLLSLIAVSASLPIGIQTVNAYRGGGVNMYMTLNY